MQPATPSSSGSPRRRSAAATRSREARSSTGAGRRGRFPPEAGTPRTDPFTETTEQVGGFFVIETDDLDDLLDCCQIIAKLGDGIEVRRTVQPEERAG